MHARLDQLLSLRDGAPVDAEVREHLLGCADCASSLAASSRLREQLMALPEAPSPSDDAWASIELRVAGVHRRRRRAARLAPVAAAASIAALAMFAALRWVGTGSPEPQTAATTAPAPNNDSGADLAELQARSQALEAALATLPVRPAVERAATSLPIESLEGQLQWLDHQLTLADADGPSPRAERLWRDRVEVMNSLVQLRYVEAQHVMN